MTRDRLVAAAACPHARRTQLPTVPVRDRSRPQSTVRLRPLVAPEPSRGFTAGAHAAGPAGDGISGFFADTVGGWSAQTLSLTCFVPPVNRFIRTSTGWSDLHLVGQCSEVAHRQHVVDHRALPPRNPKKKKKGKHPATTRVPPAIHRGMYEAFRTQPIPGSILAPIWVTPRRAGLAPVVFTHHALEPSVQLLRDQVVRPSATGVDRLAGPRCLLDSQSPSCAADVLLNCDPDRCSRGDLIAAMFSGSNRRGARLAEVDAGLDRRGGGAGLPCSQANVRVGGQRH